MGFMTISFIDVIFYINIWREMLKEFYTNFKYFNGVNK